jgi:hypothetical protein
MVQPKKKRLVEPFRSGASIVSKTKSMNEKRAKHMEVLRNIKK